MILKYNKSLGKIVGIGVTGQYVFKLEPLCKVVTTSNIEFEDVSLRVLHKDGWINAELVLDFIKVNSKEDAIKAKELLYEEFKRIKDLQLSYKTEEEYI